MRPPVRVQLAAQWSILVQWEGVWRTGLDADELAVDAIYVLAADGYHPLRDPAKDGHEVASILLCDGNHVHHDMGCITTQPICRFCQVASVTEKMLDLVRKICLRVAAIEDGDLAPVVVEARDHVRTHEAGSAEN